MSPVVEVWAPDARHVTVVWAAVPVGAEAEASGNVTRSPMSAREGGWWSAGLPDPDDGGAIDYAFSLDGRDPRPDPRSAWQPRGVHAPSRTFDPAAYPWGDGDWRGTRGGIW